jgi:hypothetical protein
MSLDFFPCQNPSNFSISFTTDAIQYNTIGCFVLAQKNRQKLSLVESHKKDFESMHMAHHTLPIGATHSWQRWKQHLHPSSQKKLLVANMCEDMCSHMNME